MDPKNDGFQVRFISFLEGAPSFRCHMLVFKGVLEINGEQGSAVSFRPWFNGEIFMRYLWTGATGSGTTFAW